MQSIRQQKNNNREVKSKVKVLMMEAGTFFFLKTCSLVKILLISSWTKMGFSGREIKKIKQADRVNDLQVLFVSTRHVKTDRQTDRQTGRQTDRQTDFMLFFPSPQIDTDRLYAFFPFFSDRQTDFMLSFPSPFSSDRQTDRETKT